VLATIGVLATIVGAAPGELATSEAVVLMTGPVVGLLTTIAPGNLGAIGGLLLCAPQLPNPARMMRHLTWSRTRVDDALLRRKAVDERHECAQRLSDPLLAAPKKAPTSTARQNVSRFCTDGHAS
jgi:hypothetical protein